jgi:hypothetical protein
VWLVSEPSSEMVGVFLFVRITNDNRISQYIMDNKRFSFEISIFHGIQAPDSATPGAVAAHAHANKLLGYSMFTYDTCSRTVNTQ